MMTSRVGVQVRRLLPLWRSTVFLQRLGGTSPGLLVLKSSSPNPERLHKLPDGTTKVFRHGSRQRAEDLLPRPHRDAPIRLVLCGAINCQSGQTRPAATRYGALGLFSSVARRVDESGAQQSRHRWDAALESQPLEEVRRWVQDE